ncbi:MAG: glycogen synthase, partial [Thiohalomonadales bacterium]
MLKILFATSEVHPLIKTGGLADVSAGLPIALSKLGHQVRLVLPAYQQIMQQVTVKNTLSKFSVPGIVGEIEILECKLPGTEIKVLLVNYAAAFDRPGNPYINPNGSPWPDNAERFYLFCRAIQALATDNANINWRPDILHCNDWQTGLAPAFLQKETIRPATLFSIHNLAYQGLYSHSTFVSLGLPSDLWQSSGLEFHGQFSFIKGGIVYSHRINTVSPTYMEEIKTTIFGFGLEGLLKYRQRVCSG